MKSGYSKLRSGFVLFALAFFLIGGVLSGYAAILTVTNTNDSGAGSLRQAIVSAVSGDIIDFNLTYPATITLTSLELLLNKDITISGPGARNLTISGNNASRVFSNISSLATISGLTISNGNAVGASGGGIYNTGVLNLLGVTLSNNRANYGGGGIYNNGKGSILLHGVTVANNSDTFSAGGGVYNLGTLNVINSTFSDNRSPQGGAIFNSNTLLSRNATFTNNSTSISSAAIAQIGGAGLPELNLYNTIISDNKGRDLYGTPTTAHNNLIQAQVFGNLTTNSVGNITGISAILGLLANNSGATDTYALLSGSPAINAGELKSCTVMDQRGVSRMRQGGCDIGAYEVSTPLGLTTAKSTVKTLAGQAGVFGAADGAGALAQFNTPTSVATDGTNLYVADRLNHTIRKIVIETGAVYTLAGSAGAAGYADGIGTLARFNRPYGLVATGSQVYVADTGNNRIRSIDIATGTVTTIAGDGTAASVDGIGTIASFNAPVGLIQALGSLYVSDNGSHRIRKIHLHTGIVSTVAGSIAGYADGYGGAAQFNSPFGLATNDTTTLYVADEANNRIRAINITSGKVSTLAGSGTASVVDGIGSAAGFAGPVGLALDEGQLYVNDFSGQTIRRVDLSTVQVTTIAGSSGNIGTADGIGTTARFNNPAGMVHDGVSLFIADGSNHTIRTVQEDTVPPIDGILTAAPVGNSRIDLSWTAATDVLGGVASYKVALAPGGADLLPDCTSGVDVGNTTSYSHTGLSPGQSFAYKVCAVDNAGNMSSGILASAMTSFVTVTPTSYDYGSQQVGSSSSPLSFTVSNTNIGMPVSITPILSGTNAGDYILNTSGCGTVPPFFLMYSSSCTLTVAFAPTAGAAAVRNASLSVQTNETGGPIITSALSGSATVSVTAATGANGSITLPGPALVAAGTNLTYTITPDIGYHVADVLVDTVSIGAVTSYTFTSLSTSHIISASFANSPPIASPQSVSVVENGSLPITLSGTDPEGSALSYTVISNPANGTISGTVPNLTYTPTAGYVGSDSFTFTVSDGVNTSATATIAIAVTQLYQTVTFVAGANGTITGTTTQTIPWNGTTSTVQAVPNVGFPVAAYHFVNWTGTGGFVTTTANPLTITNVTSDMTITASFAINSYILTYAAGINGSISGTTPQTVNYNTSGTAVTAVPATGYQFVQWSDGVTTATRTDSNITSDLGVTASFQQVLPTISEALRVLQIAAGQVTPTAAEMKLWDIAPLVGGVPSSDGHIDLGDVILILRRTLGLISW